MSISLFLSLAPFILFLILLLWKKTSLLTASVSALAVFSVCAIFYWKIVPTLLMTSYVKGFFIAFDIFFIIFGAIFFLSILHSLGILRAVSYYLGAFSKDYRVQVVVIGWFFGNFLEGTAGFGTPVAIVAPLLIALGISPLRALAIGLLGNSVSGIFGAAGTPIRVGFGGLDTTAVPFFGALFGLVGIIIPIFMIWIASGGRPFRWREFVEATPFALLAGGAFSISSLATVALGQEFPSILGAVIGLFIVFIFSKCGLFVPKKSISLVDARATLSPSISSTKAFFPYVILIGLLFLGKFLFGSFGVIIPWGGPHTINFFNPGFVFIIAGLLVLLLWRCFGDHFTQPFKAAVRGAISPFIVIIAMSAFVQLLINSGTNASGLPSALFVIAWIFETNLLPLWAPFVGAFGSFVTGSVTISNIMFGRFLDAASSMLLLPNAIVLALTLVGGAIGNMIALADMLAGEAIVGVKNKEREILKLVILPCLVCLTIVGVIGMFFHLAVV